MNKKIFILYMALCLVLTGCSLKTGSVERGSSYSDVLDKMPSESGTSPTTTNATTVQVPVTTQAPKSNVMPNRTVDISSGISGDGLSFSYKFDFDFDGKKENVLMKVKGSYDSGQTLSVSVGKYAKNLEFFDGEIDAVYACDIDRNDNLCDLAIITMEMSGDPRLRILKYDPNLTPYKFYSDYDGSYMEENWLGYAVSYYFNINNDDTLTLEEQTSSYGMWSVYRKYRRNSAGAFVEVKPDKYNILPDFMNNQLTYDNDMDYEETVKVGRRIYKSIHRLLL